LVSVLRGNGPVAAALIAISGAGWLDRHRVTGAVVGLARRPAGRVPVVGQAGLPAWTSWNQPVAGRADRPGVAWVGGEKISPDGAEELAACFPAHARDLFGYACVLARGDRALADDLVQAAFEAAGGAWWTLRCLAEDQRRSWLRKTLANIAVS